MLDKPVPNNEDSVAFCALEQRQCFIPCIEGNRSRFLSMPLSSLKGDCCVYVLALDSPWAKGLRRHICRKPNILSVTALSNFVATCCNWVLLVPWVHITGRRDLETNTFQESRAKCRCQPTNMRPGFASRINCSANNHPSTSMQVILTFGIHKSYHHIVMIVVPRLVVTVRYSINMYKTIIISQPRSSVYSWTEHYWVRRAVDKTDKQGWCFQNFKTGCVTPSKNLLW
jgi:hypothetical protein